MLDFLLGVVVIAVAADATILRWRLSIAMLVWAGANAGRYRAELLRGAGTHLGFGLWSALTILLFGVWHCGSLKGAPNLPLPRSEAALRDLLIGLIVAMAFWPNSRWRRQAD